MQSIDVASRHFHSLDKRQSKVLLSDPRVSALLIVKCKEWTMPSDQVHVHSAGPITNMEDGACVLRSKVRSAGYALGRRVPGPILGYSTAPRWR